MGTKTRKIEVAKSTFCLSLKNVLLEAIKEHLPNLKLMIPIDKELLDAPGSKVAWIGSVFAKKGYGNHSNVYLSLLKHLNQDHKQNKNQIRYTTTPKEPIDLW